MNSAIETTRQIPMPLPKLIGVATSSFQVEGNPDNTRNTNWDRFLEKHPDIVTPEEKGPEWWIKGNAEADIDRLAEIGINSLRISIERARVEPKKGEFSEEALQRYREIIDHAKAKGIEPMLTLHHFTDPGWFEDNGGWENKQNIQGFLSYTKKVVESFPDVKWWVTFNEPNVYINAGFYAGVFPPEKKSIRSAFKARKNILRANKKATKIIKDALSDAKVGLTYAFRPYQAKNENSKVNRKYVDFANYIETTNYVNATVKSADFIGINFYTGVDLEFNPKTVKFKMRDDAVGVPETVLFGRTTLPEGFRSDMGWPSVPDRFLKFLRRTYKKYKKDLFITEFGIADKEDKYRATHTLTHATGVAKALSENIPVLGMSQWSAIDNLEWAEGYNPRFGVIANGPVTGERQIRKSSSLYGDIAKAQSIDPEKLIPIYIKDEQQQEAKEAIEKLLYSPTH